MGVKFPAFPPEYREHWVSKGLWRDATLHDLFDETVATHPDETAIVTSSERVSFKEFKERSDSLAAGLLEAGVGQGEIVTVQLPNWPELCYLQIALSRVGAVIHPMHMAFREREMESLLGFCESGTYIGPATSGDLDNAKAVVAMRGNLPALKRVIAVRAQARGEWDYSFDDLPPSCEPVAVPSDADRIFYLNFTSGTEGDPKGFLHTHNTLISFFKLAADFMKASDPDAVNLACSPMTHSFGHFTTYQTAVAGIPMVLIEKFEPGEVLRLIESEKVTTLSGTPAHLFSLLRHPDFESTDTSSLKSLSAGGARSSPELIAEIEEKLGLKTGNTYGMGENVIHTRTLPFDPPEKVSNTVGRPLPTAELKIVNPGDRTEELAAGEIGEIAFRGPTLFVGYLKQPELTAATRDGDGWFFTGDLGFVDHDGYLCFASRSSEVINRGGTKIYPKEIEDLLMAHPSIEQCAVVPMPDERLGERSCAYVVSGGGPSLDREDLAEYLDGMQVSKYKIPDEVVVIDQLPMTPTAKVRKAELVEDARRRHEMKKYETGEEHPPKPDFMSDEEWNALISTRDPEMIRMAGAGHAKAYEAAGGKGLDQTQGGPVLVLTMRGRKSGNEISTCLNYAEADGGYIVVGSFAGFASDPNWALNLEADPHATVTIHEQSRSVVALKVTGEERAALWPLIAAKFPLWGHFQSHCSREFPVFLLEPEGD